jgi:hypothetical protein
VIRGAQRWLAGRSERERRLVTLAAGVTVVTLVASAGLAVRDDLETLATRVAAHEHELQQVRRLAAGGGAPSRAPGDDGALMTRFQSAADAAALADRVTAMTPSADAEAGGGAARLTARLTGTSLGEAVRLLHALDRDGAPLGVARLALRKHPDDPQHFDLTLEVTDGAP